METRHWQDWITGLVGVWLIASPWFLPLVGPEGASTTLITWNFVIAGVVALALGAAAVSVFSEWEEYADIIVALWLIISPWMLGFTAFSMATTNAVVCGAVILVAAAWAIYDVHRMGHA